MRCYAFPYIHRYFRRKSVVCNPCILLYKRGFRYPTACYSNVLILTDGVRIYCGITSERKRRASSAPALFILVRIKNRANLLAIHTVPRTDSDGTQRPLKYRYADEYGYCTGIYCSATSTSTVNNLRTRDVASTRTCTVATTVPVHNWITIKVIPGYTARYLDTDRYLARCLAIPHEVTQYPYM